MSSAKRFGSKNRALRPVDTVFCGARTRARARSVYFVPAILVANSGCVPLEVRLADGTRQTYPITVN
jgi:hypothetical protein